MKSDNVLINKTIKYWASHDLPISARFLRLLLDSVPIIECGLIELSVDPRAMKSCLVEIFRDNPRDPQNTILKKEAMACVNKQEKILFLVKATRRSMPPVVEVHYYSVKDARCHQHNISKKSSFYTFIKKEHIDKNNLIIGRANDINKINDYFKSMGLDATVSSGLRPLLNDAFHSFYALYERSLFFISPNLDVECINVIQDDEDFTYVKRYFPDKKDRFASVNYRDLGNILNHIELTAEHKAESDNLLAIMENNLFEGQIYVLLLINVILLNYFKIKSDLTVTNLQLVAMSFYCAQQLLFEDPHSDVTYCNLLPVLEYTGGVERAIFPSDAAPLDSANSVSSFQTLFYAFFKQLIAFDFNIAAIFDVNALIAEVPFLQGLDLKAVFDQSLSVSKGYREEADILMNTLPVEAAHRETSSRDHATSSSAFIQTSASTAQPSCLVSSSGKENDSEGAKNRVSEHGLFSAPKRSRKNTPKSLVDKCVYFR